MSYKKHIIDTMKRLYTSNYISIRDGNVSFKPKMKIIFIFLLDSKERIY